MEAKSRHKTQYVSVIQNIVYSGIHRKMIIDSKVSKADTSKTDIKIIGWFWPNFTCSSVTKLFMSV